MDQSERERLRALQDRWLALPSVQYQIQNHGEDCEICGACSPTFKETRTLVLPDWEWWVMEFFQ